MYICALRDCWFNALLENAQEVYGGVHKVSSGWERERAKQARSVKAMENINTSRAGTYKTQVKPQQKHAPLAKTTSTIRIFISEHLLRLMQRKNNRKKRKTHVDNDTALEDAVGRVRDDVALLLQTRCALRLVADGGVHVLPLVLGREGSREHVAVRPCLQEVDLAKAGCRGIN